MIKDIFKGMVELIRGMGITGKHLGKHAITLQYPEEKMEMFERSRGIVVLLSDKETGELNCTACELCMRVCPTAAIKIVAPRDENKKKILQVFEVDNTLCCFCGLCEEACNFSALKMAGKYEFSTTDKDDLIWDVNKLQEVGRDVPYIDRRKKKPVKPVKKDKPVAPVAPAEDVKPKDESAPVNPTAPVDTVKTDEKKDDGGEVK